MIARCGIGGSIALMLMLLFVSIFSAMAAEPGNPSFLRTWERSDKPVADGQVSRTWMWSPEGFTGLLTENYADSPGGQRTVQYFDKSRMEITDPNGDQNADWYVTNGLLVVELVSGRLQVGDDSFEQRNPAEVNVAGDADDQTGPTYTSFQNVLEAPARGEGAYVMERINRDGIVTEDATLTARNIIAEHYVPETEHTVAGPFWAFMNSSGVVYRDGQYLTDTLFPNPFYATGYPITEAYWANVKVAGTYQDVLMQCFERRCLTYTPDNDPGWQVEAGNVGQHYYQWRYGQEPGDSPTPTPDPSPTPSPTPDPTPTPEPVIVDYDYAGAWDTRVNGVAAFNAPVGVAIDPQSDDVFIAESGEHDIQHFNSEGQLLGGWGTLGAGNDELDRPEGLAVEPGRVYVADFNNDRVQLFDQKGVYLDTIADATTGGLNGPMDLAINPSVGWLYIVDHLNNRILRVTTGSGALLPFGEYGTANGQFSNPNGIGIDGDGNVYVADTANQRVQKFTPAGVWIASFGTPGKGAGQFTYPRDVAVGANGRIYVVDSGDQNGGASIKVWEASNEAGTAYNFVSEWGSTGTEPNQFNYPARIAIDQIGYIYVTELLNHRVQKFNDLGVFVDMWTDATRGAFAEPVEIEDGDDGNLYVADKELGQIKVFSPAGEYLRQWSDQLEDPVDVAVRGGYAYVVDQTQNKLLKYTSDGEYVTSWGELGSADGQFSKPDGVAIDDEGYVYVVDNGNYRIQKFTAEGQFVKAWGSYGTGPGQFENSKGIAIYGDALYVVDFFPGRVQKFDLEGNHLLDISSQGAEPGQLDGPYAVTVDALGDVYVADRDNHRLQKFSADGEFLAMLSPDTTITADTTMPAFSSPTGVAVVADGTVYAVSGLLKGVMIFTPDTIN